MAVWTNLKEFINVMTRYDDTELNDKEEKELKEIQKQEDKKRMQFLENVLNQESRKILNNMKEYKVEVKKSENNKTKNSKTTKEIEDLTK